METYLLLNCWLMTKSNKLGQMDQLLQACSIEWIQWNFCLSANRYKCQFSATASWWDAYGWGAAKADSVLLAKRIKCDSHLWLHSPLQDTSAGMWTYCAWHIWRPKGLIQMLSIWNLMGYDVQLHSILSSSIDCMLAFGFKFQRAYTPQHGDQFRYWGTPNVGGN